MKRRVCVIGLDGMPVGLLRRLASEGVMPRMAERIAGASLRPMKASLPEISSVSWSSFMTGAGPGVHGIFGFTDVDPETYRLRFPGFHDLEAPTLWDRLGAAGHRSLVLNQPSTYPARTIPGTLVSGFVAVDLARAVKPLRHLGPLRRLEYRIDIDTQRGRRDHDYLLQDLDETLAARERALDHLWGEEDWSFLEVVVTGTDRIYHYLWDALQDPSHPRHQATLDYHAEVDAFVGRVLDRFAAEAGDGGREWLLSDHGFCGIVREVQINAWLRRQGYLELEQETEDGSPPRLEHISSRSRAFALDPGRIYVHRKGRFARGRVDADEAEELKAEIAAALRRLEHEGTGVIREVFDARDIYDGPQLDAGPDLLALSVPGYDLKASVGADEVFGTTDLRGMHTWDDAFLLAPTELEGDLWIGELARHLLVDMGVDPEPRPR